MKPAIRVENLSKKFRIGASNGAEYHTLRESISNTVLGPFRRLRNGCQSNGIKDFWALKDVSFEVQPGEVIGIIGRNGAGKSTLLKILSRVTEPTMGRVQYRGRIGSLLEVGTGFHPELTGRENIYLNGSILGMSHREIQRKFDVIVAFSEIEQFLDTPVKRYSSGMYVRLAFAVAAHLEPEILIVDEVLAVGDAAFQRKCLGRMSEVSRHGKTVLFVSHNIAAIEALCTHAILLDHGSLSATGHVRDVTSDFNARLLGNADAHSDLSSIHTPERSVRAFRSISLVNEQGEATNLLKLGQDCRLRMLLELPYRIDTPTIGIGFDDPFGHRVLTVLTPLCDSPISTLNGRTVVECTIQTFPLAPGDYLLKLDLSHPGGIVDSIDRAYRLVVANSSSFGGSRGFHRGACVAKSNWHSQSLDDMQTTP